MRKILLILCAILTTTSANATQMCARRDTTVIPLDAFINGKKYTSDDDVEKVWNTSFEYGIVYGIATCLSKVEVAEIEKIDIDLFDVFPMYLNYNYDEIYGRSGYYNDNRTNDALYARVVCYCKITHPMSSLWYQHGYSTVDYCTNNCADRCGHTLNGTRFWRTSIFNTIGQAPGYIDIDTNEYDESINLN